MVGGVRFALMLRQSQERGIPPIVPQPRRGVDGKSKVIFDFRTGNALRLILVKPGSPLSNGGLGQLSGLVH
jgi:hypothetical protein